MFNVKFCSVYEDGQENTHAISAPHYCIHKFSNRIEVIVYPTMTYEDGVSYTVANKKVEDGRHYHQKCYIENSAGKTVDHVHCDMVD